MSTFEPIRAFCVARRDSLTLPEWRTDAVASARIEELQTIIDLCDGLDRQFSLLASIQLNEAKK